jgi:hypothetical protein
MPTLMLGSIQLLHGGQSFRRVVVSTRDVLRPLVGLAVLNVTILTAWNIVAPLRWTRVELRNYDEYGRSTDSYGTCQSENQTFQNVFAWSLVGADLVALLSANIVNFKARQISSNLHECGAIAISMAILLEATLIGTPAMLVVEQNPSASFLIRSILVCIFCGGILLPIFVPKWHSLSLHGNDTTNPNRSDMISAVMGNDGKKRRGTVAAIRSDVFGISNPSGISSGHSISGLGDGADNPGIQTSRRARRISGIVITNRTSRLQVSSGHQSSAGGSGGRVSGDVDRSVQCDDVMAFPTTGTPENGAHDESLVALVADCSTPPAITSVDTSQLAERILTFVESGAARESGDSSKSNEMAPLQADDDNSLCDVFPDRQNDVPLRGVTAGNRKQKHQLV